MTSIIIILKFKSAALLCAFQDLYNDPSPGANVRLFVQRDANETAALVCAPARRGAEYH